MIVVGKVFCILSSRTKLQFETAVGNPPKHRDGVLFCCNMVLRTILVLMVEFLLCFCWRLSLNFYLPTVDNFLHQLISSFSAAPRQVPLPYKSLKEDALPNEICTCAPATFVLYQVLVVYLGTRGKHTIRNDTVHKMLWSTMILALLFPLDTHGQWSHIPCSLSRT
jgi:hypothetical protein